MLFNNYQWQITDYGLETNSGQNKYAISMEQLFKTFVYEGNELFYSLMLLMGREWVIREDIVEIFPIAIAHHSRKNNIDLNYSY